MDKEILYRFFNGNATEDEKIAIRKWAETSPECMNELLKERKIYNTLLFSGITELKAKRMKNKWMNPTFFIQAGKYAAVMVTAVMGMWFVQHIKSEPQDLNVVKVPVGQYVNLILADGSSVYLNSGTTFTYPTNFGKKSRMVEIDGEGYFQVQHKDNNQPFIVKTKKGSIRVLGTTFNLDAYSSKDEFITSLIEGSVEINVGKQNIILKPHEQATLENGNLVKKEALDEYYNWTGDIIKFTDIKFTDLMREFNKIYGLDFNIDAKELEKYTCSGKFRRSDGIEYALKILQLEIPFDYNYDFENRTIYIN